MKPVFRPYRSTDFNELQAMIVGLYAEDQYGEAMTVKKIRRTVEALTNQPQRGRIIICTLDKGVVGYAILIAYWSNEYGGELAVVDELYVKPDWRGRGIGRQFLEEVAQLSDRPIIGIQLEVSPQNERARAFYRQMGFQPYENQIMLRVSG